MGNIDTLKIKYQQLGDEINEMEKQLEENSNTNVPVPYRLIGTIQGMNGLIFNKGKQILIYNDSENLYKVYRYFYSGNIGCEYKKVKLSNINKGDMFMVTMYNNIFQIGSEDLENRLYYLKIEGGYMGVTYDGLQISHYSDHEMECKATANNIYKIVL